MTAQQEVSVPITQESTLADSASEKQGQIPVQRKSFLAKPHVFEKAKSGLKTTGNTPTTAKFEAPDPMTTKTTTHTKTEIVDGKRVEETTTTTVTEPKLPKGFRGKFMKTLSRGKRTTHQVVTRKTTPLESPISEAADAQVPRVFPGEKASPKKQRGEKRVSTPMPVRQGGSAESFFSPSKAEASQELFEPVFEPPEIDTVSGETKPHISGVPSMRAAPKKQRGVKRVSTPAPMSHGKSAKSFFAPSKTAVASDLLELLAETSEMAQTETPAHVPRPSVAPANASANTQQREMKRASTRVAVPLGGSEKTSFSASKPGTKADLLEPVAEAPEVTEIVSAVPEPSPVAPTNKAAWPSPVEPAKNPTIKKQRELKIVSTPVPVSQEGSVKKFFAPSKPATEAHLLDPFAEALEESETVSAAPEPQPSPAAPTNKAAEPNKQRGVSRVSIPVHVPYEGSTNSFLAPSKADNLLEPFVETTDAALAEKKRRKEEAAHEKAEEQRRQKEAEAKAAAKKKRREEEAAAAKRGAQERAMAEAEKERKEEEAAATAAEKRKEEEAARAVKTNVPIVITDLKVVPNARTQTNVHVPETPERIANAAPGKQRGVTRVATPAPSTENILSPQSPLSVTDPIQETTQCKPRSTESSKAAPLKFPSPALSLRKPKVAAPVPSVGVPTMFAHAFGNTPRRVRAPKQQRTSRTTAPSVASNEQSSAHPLAPVSEATPALKPACPGVGGLTALTPACPADLDNPNVAPILEPDYDEFTVLTEDLPDVYEITYFEEETVLDESQHAKDKQQDFSSTCKTAPSCPGKVQLEGMELLMSNIRSNVPTVNS